MSSHRTNGDKAENDFYPTEDLLCRRILSVLPPVAQDGEVLEPSFGGGNFVRAIHDGWGVRPEGCEPFDYPNTAQLPLAHHHTGRFERLFPPKRYAAIIGNPPFSMAAAHVQQALFLLRPGGYLAFLLRSGFAATIKRARQYRRFPPRLRLELTQRPSFDGSGGTDSSEYTVFIFQRGYAGPTFSEPFSWKGEDPDDIQMYRADRDLIIKRHWRGLIPPGAEHVPANQERAALSATA